MGSNVVNRRLAERWKTLAAIVSSGGLPELRRRLVEYARYHSKEKWKFVYFESSLDGRSHSLPPRNQTLVVRVATRDDIPRLESDIYPFLSRKEQTDKAYIARLGESGITLFVGEIGHRLVHYFLIFENAAESPLVKTPLDKAKIFDTDAYLGSAFTVPSARGLWITPYSMSKIFAYLHTETRVKRVLVLVHEGTPGAVGFYRRLGFRVIEDPCRAGPLTPLRTTIGRLWS